MPKFSKRSKERLSTCVEEIQDVMNLAIEFVDFSVICGHRGEEAQNKAFRDGFSKLTYPNSNHNTEPSVAVDVIPYPSGYNATDEEWEKLSLVIKVAAAALEVDIEWGGDWRNFIDKPHWEI